MFFLKGNWPIIVVGFVVVSVGIFLVWRNNVSQETVVIYKTTQPIKQQTNMINSAVDSRNPVHGHNHSHDPTTHFHTVQKSAKDEAPDWRDDSTLDAPPKTDPWKNLYMQQADTAAASREVYPPRNWHLTEDPELFVEYYRAVLLERFGDIPQVHIVVEDERKQRLGLSQTLDELITYLEALYYLFPRKETLRSLEHARELKAEGGQVNIIQKEKPR